MINDIENKSSLNEMSDLEHDKNQLEMMRYRVNNLSYTLGLLGIFASILGAFVLLNSMNPTNALVIVKILVNIGILLGGFLCVEKAKNYSKGGSITLVGLGGVCAFRIFLFPLVIMTNYAGFVDAFNKGESTAKYEKWIGMTITGYYKNNTTRWLDHSGYTRAILAIVLLAAAAALLIAAGVIGFIRSTKLTNYLNSLNQEK